MRLYRRKRRRVPRRTKRPFAIQKIPQFRNLAPQSITIRDTYQTQIKMSDQGSVNGMSALPHVAFWEASSGYAIFNPLAAGGRSSWSTLSATASNMLGSLTTISQYRRSYSHYYVLGSKMTVTVMPTANYNAGIEGNVQIACGTVRDMSWPTSTSSGGTPLGEFTDARNTTTRQIMASPGVAAGAPQAGSRARMFATYSPKSTLGIKDVEDNEDLRVSVVDGKATEKTFFYLALQGLNPGGGSDPVAIAPYIINVKVDYTLKFVEPIAQFNQPL